MTQKILAIDLGTYSLKALLIERSYDEFRVTHAVEHILNQQARLDHQEQIVLALDHIFQDENFTQADLVTSAMPGHLVANRILELPFSSRKRIQEVLDFELEGYVPFPIEDLFSDFHILNSSSEMTHVLASYLQNSKLSSYLETLSHKGIDPKYFGSDLLDFSNLSHVAMIPKEGFYVLCDIGHTKTNICIMEGTNLLYARTLAVGGIHFTRAIQREYNLNYDKAESLKVSRGKIYVREKESDQISRVLTHVAEEIITLIKQTIMAFQKNNGQIPISAFYCCGGASQLVGLIDYMSFHLKTNVMEINPFSMMPHDVPDIEEKGLKLAPSLALALRVLFSTRAPRVNFRKGPYAYTQDLQAITSEFKSVGVFLFLILAMAVGYYFYSDHYYQQKIVALDKQVETWVQKSDFDIEVNASRRGKSSNSVKRYLRAARAKLKEIDKQFEGFGSSTDFNVVEIMNEISSKLPPKSEINFQVSEFKFNEDFLRLTAQTDDPLNTTKIVNVLQSSNYFKTVEADDPKAKPGNIWDFVLKLDIKKSTNDTEEE